MHLPKVTADSARGRNSKWPLSAVLKKNLKCNIYGIIWARKTNEVSFPLTMASQLVWNDYFTVLVTPWPLNPRWPLSAILKIAHLVPRIVNTMLWYHFSPSFALDIHENVSWMHSMDYIGISLFYSHYTIHCHWTILIHVLFSVVTRFTITAWSTV